MRRARGSRAARRSRGFTLVEVLVAIAIVALGMAAVLGALSSSANTVSYMKDRTLAEWVALNQIANTRLQIQQQQLPQVGNTTGEIDLAGRSWHWRQEVTQSQVQGIERIDVKVRPAEIKGDDDNGWFVTVTGIAGNAVAQPTGTTPVWSTGVGGNGPGEGGNGNGTNPANGANGGNGANTPTTPAQPNNGTTPTPTPNPSK